MTLVISEVSRFGIVMAADSAITNIFPQSWTLSSGNLVPPTVRIGAQKIIQIQSINAAIAFWGSAVVGGISDCPDDVQIPLDQFLLDFARSIQKGTSLEEVGERLAEIVNARTRVREARGFHLAGYKQKGDRRFPALYHIHTEYDPNQPQKPLKPLKLYRDYPFKWYSDKNLCLQEGETVDQWLEDLKAKTFHLRNGTYDVYAYFSKYLHHLMMRLQRDKKFICPYYPKFSSKLEARRRFLKLQVQTICEFYRLSNREETIAMPISSISIAPERIEYYEPIVI